MKNTNYKKILIWSVLILFIASLFIYKKISDGDKAELTGPVSSQKPPAKKLTINGIIINFARTENTIFSSGSLLGDEEVELKPEIAGKIVKISFSEGAKVKRGDLLVKLNDNDLQPQLRKAEAKLKLLVLTEQRQRQLFEKQGISKQDYDIATTELMSQRAEIEYLNAMIDRTEIKAPFDGTIGLRNISEGAYVNQGSIIATLQKIDYLKIDFSIPQKYLNTVRKNSKLYFKVPPDTNAYEVNLIGTEPKIDEKTRTFKLRGRFNNSNKKLLPGSYAEVYISTDANLNTVTIPSYSLIPDLVSEYVFVYSNGITTKRNVRTGIRSDDSIEIIEGLNPGDTLITSGIMQLRPGMPVNIKIVSSNGNKL